MLNANIDLKQVVVTVGEWSDSELPVNAIERYKFIGDQIAKIPHEHRGSAEFSSEDWSFDRDGSEVRTTLTYMRLETVEEARDRADRNRTEKSGPTGGQISLVDGVLTISNDGVVRVRIWGLDKDQAPTPAANRSGQDFINSTLVYRRATDPRKLPRSWSVTMKTDENGQYVCGGLKLGFD